MRLDRKLAGLVFLVIVFGCVLFVSSGVWAQGLISIDTNKKYEGMNASFAKGYVPSIRKHTMQLVVPFQTDLTLKQDCLFVGVSFDREENSPFYFKNYQKKVKQSKRGIYLYRCNIKLKKDRVNGQYPLHLTVQAQMAEEVVQQEFTIYVEITDGKKAALSEEILPEELETDTAAKPETASENGKEEKREKPKVILDGNNLNGTSIKAGEAVSWKLFAKNCSSSQPLENLKVTLLSEQTNLSFEKTSWYFSKIEALGTIDLSQNIFIGAKAAAEGISIQFLFDYEDKNGENYQVSETVPLVIAQTQQASLVDLKFPESIYESDTDMLTFQVINTGLSMLYNAKVRFVGKGLFAEKELFLGNLEAGTSLDGELSVFAGTLNMDESGEILEGNGEKYGDTSGTVIFSYENELGEVTEQKQEIYTTIRKPQVVELKVEEEAPKTNQWWVTIFVLVILVLVLVIVWLVVRLKYYRSRV